MLEELFSADILLFNAFIGQLFHHLDLGGDGRVIGAGPVSYTHLDVYQRQTI